MTISSLVRSAGPFLGNGVTTAFPFLYKVFSKADVIVTLTVIATGLESTLVVDSDFTVALNADQDANPGGTVTYNPLGVPMPATHKLTLTSGVSLLQTLALTIGGGFSPSAIMSALDRAIICIQQAVLTIGRGLTAAVSDTAPGPLPNAATRALNFLAFDASGDPIASAGGASTPVSVAMAPVVAAATIAAGRVAMEIPFVLLASAAAAASSSLDFTSAYINSTYDEYELHIVDLVPATNAANLLLRVSQSGVFDSGGTSYAYTFLSNNDGGAVSAGGAATASSIALASNCSAEATRSVNAVVKIYKPSGTTHRKAFGFNTHYQADTVVATALFGTGAFQNGVGAIDGIRLLMSSGNIASGTAYLYGVRKS